MGNNVDTAVCCRGCIWLRNDGAQRCTCLEKHNATQGVLSASLALSTTVVGPVGPFEAFVCPCWDITNKAGGLEGNSDIVTYMEAIAS